MSAVSERIKALIEQSGLSYRSLAKKVGVSNVTVRNWAIGHSEPNREGLEALCEIFGVTPAKFFLAIPTHPSKPWLRTALFLSRTSMLRFPVATAF